MTTGKNVITKECLGNINTKATNSNKWPGCQANTPDSRGKANMPASNIQDNQLTDYKANSQSYQYEG